MSGPPVLVTGMPRSGTTWVARQLASSPRTALAGREPMNPRDGQYALGGSVQGWARLTELTHRQRLDLQRAYTGRNPWVYSRFGLRQWAAPWPGTRLIIKDPFAMLSLAAIHHATDALPVLVYRHPGAVLTSFRRMGWSPKTEEIEHLESLVPHRPPTSAATTDVQRVARMWTVLHRIALHDLDVLPRALVAAHEDLAVDQRNLDQLRARCDLAPARAVRFSRRNPKAKAPQSSRLHNLDRNPKDVAKAWRLDLPLSEQQELDSLTGDLLLELKSRTIGGS